MNNREAEFLLSGGLSELLIGFGFEAVRPLLFLRSGGKAIDQSLGFSLREKSPGLFALGCGIGIRFQEIETVIGRESDDQFKATIGMPIHLLREDKAYFEWEFLSPEDVPIVIGSVIHNVQELALPFLGKFSFLSALRTALESDLPQDHFVLTSEGRAIILAGVFCVMDGRGAALRFVTEELTKRSTGPPKYRTELRLLKKKLETLESYGGKRS